MPENSDICHFPDPPRRQLDNAASEGRKEGREEAFFRPLRVASHLFFAAPFSALGRHLSRGRTFQANSPLMISHSTESGASAESGDYSALSTLGGESGRCFSRPSSILELHFLSSVARARCFRILSRLRTRTRYGALNKNESQSTTFLFISCTN